MTNKLVAIINSLKVPKIKKILLYEKKFLVPNYRCLQNPWLGGYRPQIPVLSVLCPQLNFLNLPPPNKIPGYATGSYRRFRTTYRPDLHWSQGVQVLIGLFVTLELGPIGSPETSIIKYLSTLRTASKERRFLLHHGRILTSPTKSHFSSKQISWFII